MRTPRIIALVAVGTLGSALAACSGGDKAADTAAAGAGGPIAVKATDTGCEVAKNTLDAGTHVFSITNSGAKVTEFYVYAAGDRVMGEVENITPGLSRELRVELPAGTYQTACKPGMIGAGIRAALTVSGSAPALTEDVVLQQATADYTRYITSQSEALVQKTGDFVNAVKAGDIEKAKTLYPIARTYYERIEPVAEIFGDLDPKVDGREDGATKELPFTGFHRLEKDLWVNKDVSKDGAIADQLLVDVKEVVTKAKDEKLSPLQLGNGAKELLD
jgi:iron uptake system component EfeO